LKVSRYLSPGHFLIDFPVSFLDFLQLFQHKYTLFP
jgi:hypothetical protein